MNDNVRWYCRRCYCFYKPDELSNERLCEHCQKTTDEWRKKQKIEKVEQENKV